MKYKKSHCAATKFMLCITLYDIAILKGKLKKRLQPLKKTKQTTGKSVNQHRGKENRKKTNKNVPERHEVSLVKQVGKALKKSYVSIPAGIYLLQVNNGYINKMCEICSKLIKTPYWFWWNRSCVLIVILKQGLIHRFDFSMVDLEQLNTGWNHKCHSSLYKATTKYSSSLAL